MQASLHDAVQTPGREACLAAIAAALVAVDGADEDGRTPLMMAALYHSDAVAVTAAIAALVAAGADVHAADNDGHQAVHVAAAFNLNAEAAAAAVSALLEAGELTMVRRPFVWR